MRVLRDEAEALQRLVDHASAAFPHLTNSLRAAIEKSTLNSSLIQGVHAASAVMIALESFRAGRVGAQRALQAAIESAARLRLAVEGELEERARAWSKALGCETRTTVRDWLKMQVWPPALDYDSRLHARSSPSSGACDRQKYATARGALSGRGLGAGVARRLSACCGSCTQERAAQPRIARHRPTHIRRPASPCRRAERASPRHRTITYERRASALEESGSCRAPKRDLGPQIRPRREVYAWILCASGRLFHCASSLVRYP